MKGVLGLTLAAGLGIIGAMSNWFYLQRLARSEEKVYFVAIKSGVTLNAGDLIKKEHLAQVGIPRSGVDYLSGVAPQWSAVASVEGVRANRPFRGGEIILNQDLTGPNYQSMARSLQENEVVRWVPIDAGTIVPEHINPGDWVSFDVPRIGGAVPTPAGSDTQGSAARPFAVSEIIGPFRVASLGARREPENVWGGNRRPGGSESRVAIIVELQGDRLEPKAERLFEAIRLAGNQGVQVQLHSAKLDQN
jgi:hypothetical protein